MKMTLQSDDGQTIGSINLKPMHLTHASGMMRYQVEVKRDPSFLEDGLNETISYVTFAETGASGFGQTAGFEVLRNVMIHVAFEDEAARVRFATQKVTQA